MQRDVDYMSAVCTKLSQEGYRFTLSLEEQALVKLGENHGVGPNDCACQIMDDRKDAMDKSMIRWRSNNRQ